MDENGIGYVDFLIKDMIDDTEEQGEYILQKCRDMDVGYIYEECSVIE